MSPKLKLKLKLKLSRAFLFALVTLIPTAMARYVYAYELPDLGRPSATALTSQEEQKMGREFMQEVQSSVRLVEDPITTDYIERLGQSLVKYISVPSFERKKFHFFVAQDHTINAFAGPDGYIGVNSGLILATRSESELAAVLAHEIAHVTQHHLERMMSQASASSIPMAAAAIAALAVGIAGGGGAASSAGVGAAMTALAGGMQQMINFTRSNEAEADHIGMDTLHKAGFDTRAMPAFFARIQQASLEYGEQVPPYLRTHPVSAERIADAMNRAAQYPRSSAAWSSQNDSRYLLMHTRLEYFALRNRPNAASYFKTRSGDISGEGDGDDVKVGSFAAARYGYALALMGKHQWQEAAVVINELIKSNPNEVIYYMAKAEMQAATKQKEAALTTLQNISSGQRQNYYPLAVQYAQTLAQSGQFVTAQNILRQQLQQPLLTVTNKAITYALLSEYAAKSGKRADAYLYRAQALMLLGDYRQANLLLQQALRLSDLSVNMRALLQAEQTRAKQRLAQEK